MLLAACLHAAWNALVKAGGDRLVVLACVNFTGVIVGAIGVILLPLPAPEAWPYLIASAIFHTGYYFYLLNAYSKGDLVQVYPLARGSAPLLITFGGYLFAGENMGSLAVCGILLASFGIVSLSFERGWPFGKGNHAVSAALITSLWIAAYSVTDGLGGRLAGNVLSYISWLAFIDGWPIILYTLYRRGATLPRYFASHWRYCMTGGVFSLLAYGLIIYAMTMGAMGMISALRETSVIIAALIGVIILKERFTLIRVASVLMVAAGVILMHATATA
ncbi:MAG: drug/metabolite transporter (DMT)-like permease [Parasphingorhabdus sp.]